MRRDAEVGPRRHGRAFRVAVRMFLVTAVLLAALAVHLEVRGFPEAVRLRVLKRLQDAGVELYFARLRYSLRRGLLADDARFFLNSGDACPLLVAHRIGLQLDWIEALRGRWFLSGANVRDGVLHLDPGEPGRPRCEPAVDHLRLNAHFDPGGCRVDGSTSVAGIPLEIDGFIVGFPTKLDPARPRPAVDIRRLAAGRLRQVRAILERAGVPEFPGKAQGRVEFFFCPDDSAQNEVKFGLEAADARWRGMTFGALRVSAGLATNVVRLHEFTLQRGASALTASGEYELTTRLLDATVRGAMPADFWFNLPLPPAPAERLARSGAHTAQPVQFELRTGRQPLTNALAAVQGRFAVAELEVLGVPLERLAFHYRREGTTLHFEQVDAVAGAGAGKGPLRGSGSYDFETRTYRGRLEAGFDPQTLMPLLNPNQSLYVGAIRARSALPDIRCEFSGQIGDIRALKLHGTAAARDFIYNGSWLAGLTATFSVTNQVLRLDELVAERPEGRLAGWIHQDFKARMIDFNIDSRMDPYAAARMIGPFPHRFMQKFRIEGPAHIVAAGRVDYGRREDNDVKADVESEGFGLRWFVTEKCSFHLENKGRRVELTDVKGVLHGGAFAGRATFELPRDAEPRTHYEVTGRIDGADFNRIIRDLADSDRSAYEGRLTTDFRIAGFMGQGEGPTATGEGTMKIAEGKLMTIPLFGGLSRILTHIYPGLGFASQSDFVAPFKIVDGRFVSEEAELRGEMLTIRGRGDYFFDERLKFIVEVKLLKEGAVAEVIRLLTLPVTKLFEFDLTGTLRAPQWEPRNLPKELFLKFD